jgi:hypothetical protein
MIVANNPVQAATAIDAPVAPLSSARSMSANLRGAVPLVGDRRWPR